MAVAQRYESLIDLLELRASSAPDKTAYAFLVDGETEQQEIAWAALDRRVRAVATVVQGRCAPGERVIALLPPGLDFIAAFLACSYAGAVAVPAFRPTPARAARMLTRLERIARDAGAGAVITVAAVRDRLLKRVPPELAEIPWISVDEVPEDAADGWRRPSLSRDDLALLQYTSGSTSDPKGVMVTHGNLLANLAYLQTHLEIDPDTMSVFWVPPYHDLGLVGGILGTLYCGNSLTLMAPSHFLQRPYRWLRALSETRSTIAAAPNFALELCVRATTPEERARLDLSSLRVLLSGGEPVQGRTIARFAEAFAVAGFDPRATTPAYGLAEATLMVSAARVGRQPTCRPFDRQALQALKAQPVEESAPGATVIVGCGPANPESDLRIVDPQRRVALPPGRVGEVWIRGPSIAAGYWNRAELTEQTFGARLADGEGPFLRTGDLGFLLDGELHVTGRLKDLIILHGCNHHPPDLEQTATLSDPALVPSGAAAFELDIEGEARLGIVHEVADAPGLDLEAVAARVRAAIAREHDLPIHRLVLIRPGVLPRTGNGKIQRPLARQLVAENALSPLLDKGVAEAAAAEATPALADADDKDDGERFAAWLEDEVRRATGGRGEVARDVPMAALGLDSVQLADIVRRLETSFRVALPISDVSGEMSIVQLAQCALGMPPDGQDERATTRRSRFRELPEFVELGERLSALESVGIDNPFFRVHERVARATTRIDGREITNFASYNYLALSGHEAVSTAAKQAIDDFGTSVSASRLVSGERSLHVELERAIARWLGTESCLVFVSGNLANVTTLGHLAGPGDLIVHDALAHDSIVQGALLSGAARRSFPHNDWRALDQLLDAVRDGYGRVIAVVEGVYSMDGDIPDLPRFVEVKDRHDAFLMVDEAHSFGVLGATGRGIAEHFAVDPAAIEIWMGTLSKTLASAGGYIAGSARLVEYLRYSAPGFVFSVGLPPPNAAAALAAIRRLEAEPERVERLRRRGSLFLELARSQGLDTGLSEGSPVIPVVLGRSDLAIEASNRLLARGLNVQPIVYPAVEEHGARLRFFICADHTEEQIRAAVAATADVVAELRGDSAPQASADGHSGVRGSASTLGDLLQMRAEVDGDRVGYVFLGENGADPERLRYGDLERRAATVAARVSKVADRGDRALLLYPAGLDFVAAFFGCLQAGVIAVPVPSPLPGRIDRIVPALRSVADDCAPRAVLTTAEIRAEAAPAAALHGIEWIATDELAPGGDAMHRPAAPEDVAYLQYTSGSTASPRGAMVSHANVFANLEAILRFSRQGRDGVCVIWLPHYHDMGLAGLLSSLYAGHPCVFMSPLAFMSRPLRWLNAVSDFGGTWTGAPSFAFELCARRARPEDVERLELRTLEWIGVGAEPVRTEALEHFARTFAPARLRPNVFAPCYGLAETVVLATGASGSPLRPVAFDARSLQQLRAVEASNGAAARTLAGCGMPPDRHEVVIADPETRRRCEDGTVGEIWYRGPSVAAGYWNRPSESDGTFRAHLVDDGSAPYLRTGDLGFLWNSELFVAGRLKDLIVVGGTNHHPQDVERTVEECHAAIRRGCVAAFSVEADVERVVVLAEVRRSAPPDEVRRAIAVAVADRHQLTVDGVGLLAPHTIPKTSSGKIRRRACRDGWLGDDFAFVFRWESPDLRAAAPEAARVPEHDGAGGEDATLEATLVERLTQILGDRVDTLDVETPLIELGLGSLQLAEVSATVEEERGVSVPLRCLLEGWSVRDIARAAAMDGAAAGPARPPSATRFERLVNPAIGGLLRQLRMDKTYVRGEGSWLVDDRGRRYLDAIAGYGSVPFGHDPPEVWAAVTDVRERAEPVFVQPSSLGAAGELAERLLEIAPPGLARVTFANSGAEAVEAAIKLVRAATGRPGIVSAVDGFHGKTLGALSATARFLYQEPFFAPVAGFESVPYGDLEALERVFVERGDEVAAFIVEPIQGEGGVIEPPSRYLRGLRELCDRHGVALVVDEVQTGLGRTGAMFVCAAEGVAPDVLVVGKALGGGLLPIGAVLYGEQVATDDFGLLHTSTFAGGALAARAGLAVLERLAANGGAVLESVRANGEVLRRGLEAVQARHPAVVRAVRGRGFLLGLELTDDGADFPVQSLLGMLAEQERLAALVSSYLLEVEGVRVAPTLLATNVLRIEPPLTFTKEQCKAVVDALERAVTHVDHSDTGALVNHLLDRPRELQPGRGAPRSSRPLRRGRAKKTGGQFAFIVHPIDHLSYGEFDPTLSSFAEAELAEITDRWSDLVEPFVVGSARVASATGAAAYGEFIVVPRTSVQLHAGRRSETLGLVRDAVELARRRGAEVVGLGGQISVVTGAGMDLGGNDVPLTTGNAYTALSAVDSTLAAAAAAGIEPAGATAAVLGAAGSVGRGVALLLAREFERLVLLGNPVRPKATLWTLRRVAESLAASLADASSGDGPLAECAAAVLRGGADAAAVAASLIDEGFITIGTDADALLPLADVVVAATSSTTPVLRSAQLRPGAVVCDIARPLNAEPSVADERLDALVFEGGLVELPSGSELDWHFGLPPRTVFACMCEPMTLALDRRYDLARVGVETPLDLLRTLATRGAEQGFRAAPLRTFGRAVDEADWRRVRAARDAARPGAGAARLT